MMAATRKVSKAAATASASAKKTEKATTRMTSAPMAGMTARTSAILVVD